LLQPHRVHHSNLSHIVRCQQRNTTPHISAYTAALPTFQDFFSALWATARGFSPASMASENSRNTSAVMEASTVSTRETFYKRGNDEYPR
jgi:hypothetical protein